MTQLLYLNASPRGDAAASTQAAQLFINALPGTVDIHQIDLFEAGLPEFSAALASAKQKFAGGMTLTEAESEAWSQVTELVRTFAAADHYLLGVPMWNFSLPYKLKQYIDLVTHPGLTFRADKDGIRGLVSGAATVIYSRGGDYSPKNGEPDPYDFQSPYLKAWLALVGLNPVEEVLVQSTMAGPEAQQSAVAEAGARLQTLAAQVG